MTRSIFLHSKSEIERFLRQDPLLHLYELGDLDDFFWPYTTWFASKTGGDVAALFLLYSGGGLPVLLAIAGQEREALRDLLEASLPLLPRRFYSHLSPGLADIFTGNFRAEPHGRYLKMGLADPDRALAVETSGVVRFGAEDAAELQAFYNAAYPGNWFDPRMLETGCYFGARAGEDGSGPVACAAGIHVYSPQYRAAALGNITTAPEYRGRGLGTKVTARLCQDLMRRVDTIGLNVRADNRAALAVYARLGFLPVAEYEEWMWEGI